MARDTRGANVAELGSGPDLAEERVQIHRRIRTVVPIDSKFQEPERLVGLLAICEVRGEEVVDLRIVVNLHASSKRLDLRFRFMLGTNHKHFVTAPVRDLRWSDFDRFLVLALAEKHFYRVCL